jgi:hypothetical protein
MESSTITYVYRGKSEPPRFCRRLALVAIKARWSLQHLPGHQQVHPVPGERH